jgi:hypothetical protein
MKPYDIVYLVSIVSVLHLGNQRADTRSTSLQLRMVSDCHYGGITIGMLFLSRCNAQANFPPQPYDDRVDRFRSSLTYLTSLGHLVSHEHGDNSRRNRLG